MDTRKAFDTEVKATFNNNTSNPFRGLSLIRKAAKRTIDRHVPTPKDFPDLDELFLDLLKVTINEILADNIQPDMFEEEKDSPWDFLTGDYFETYCHGLALNPDFVLDAVKFDIEVGKRFL